VNNYIVCFTTRPFTFQPIMENLPKSRIQAGRAFAVPGIDFAGSIKIKVVLYVINLVLYEI